MKKHYIRPSVIVKDNEGGTTTGYDTPYSIEASIQPLGGQIAAAEYGEELKYMLSMRIESLGSIKEKDGVCVYVSSDMDPDYEVISIKPWTIPVLELRKIGVK